MQVYWIFFAAIIVYSLFGLFRQKVSAQVYYAGVFVIVLFAGLRSSGFDWDSYLDIYKSTLTDFVQIRTEYVEPLFLLLCKISPTYRILIFLTAAMSISFTLFGLYKFSKDSMPLLSLVIFTTTFMLTTYMGQIRQGCAMGFVIWAAYYHYYGKNKKAALLIAIAALFHLSALLTSALLLVPRKQYQLKRYIPIIASGIVFSSLFATVLAPIMEYSQWVVVQKLLFYSETETGRLGFTSTILIRIITFFIALKLARKEDETIHYVLNLYCFGIVFYLLFGFQPQLGGRGSLYFNIFECVLVPFIIHRLRDKWYYQPAFFAVICLSIYRVYAFFQVPHNYSSYIPYFSNY